jgi:hypothetical protein
MPAMEQQQQQHHRHHHQTDDNDSLLEPAPELDPADMAGKHGSEEPSRRSFAQKLSGLISRRGSAKRKSLTPAEVSDDKGSLFGFKRHSKAPEEAVAEFKPLEVDIDSLEALRISDGWLDPTPPKPKPAPAQETLAAPVANASSVTPIADQFGSKLSAERPASPARAQESHAQDHHHETAHSSRRPMSVRDSGRRDHGASQRTGSVLERGRPVESRYLSTDLPRGSKTSRYSLPAPINTHPGRPRESSLPPPQSSQSSVSKFATMHSNMSMQRLPGEGRSSFSSNRHSMHEEAASPTFESVKVKATPLTLRSVSAAPAVDRVSLQAPWQKQNTSALNSPASIGMPSPTTAAAPQVAPLARKGSTRGGAAVNRLAWIRELEEKKSSGMNRDLPVLKKQAGSVLDKLAMFETKKSLAAPQARMPPPPPRSNSTSRFSTAGPESIFSADSNTATASPRTSIDTVRTNNRASSVMSHFDDSFREKLESLVSANPSDKEKDKATPGEKKRVSAQFVSTQPEKVAKPAVEPQVAEIPVPEVQSTKTADTEIPAAEAPKVEAETLSAPAAKVAAVEAEPAIEVEPAIEAQEVEKPDIIEEPAVKTEDVEEPSQESSAPESQATEVPQVETPAAEIPAVEIQADEVSTVESEAPAAEVPAVETQVDEVPTAESEAPKEEVPQVAEPEFVAPEVPEVKNQLEEIVAAEPEKIATEEAKTPEPEAIILEAPAAAVPEPESQKIDALVVEMPVESEVPEEKAVEVPEAEKSSAEIQIPETPAELPEDKISAVEIPTVEVATVEAPVEEPVQVEPVKDVAEAIRDIEVPESNDEEQFNNSSLTEHTLVEVGEPVQEKTTEKDITVV